MNKSDFLDASGGILFSSSLLRRFKDRGLCNTNLISVLPGNLRLAPLGSILSKTACFLSNA